MKTLKLELLNPALIVLGILSAGMGLKGFLMSSRFIDGGVTGISMLLSDVFSVPLSILIALINFPFIALGYHQIGRRCPRCGRQQVVAEERAQETVLCQQCRAPIPPRAR